MMPMGSFERLGVEGGARGYDGPGGLARESRNRLSQATSEAQAAVERFRAKAAGQALRVAPDSADDRAGGKPPDVRREDPASVCNERGSSGEAVVGGAQAAGVVGEGQAGERGGVGAGSTHLFFPDLPDHLDLAHPR